ncbi:MAG: glycosyltransferase family 39 protein, partial [Chloroflexota bacterium]
SMTIHRRRTLLFIAGLVCLVFAQILIANIGDAVIPQAFAPLIQEEFRFDLPNLENVMTGVVLLMIAAALLWSSFAPFSLPHWDERPAPVVRPNLRRFLLRYAPILAVAIALFAFLLIRLNQVDSGVGSLLIWIVVLLLLLWVAFRYDRKTGTPLSLRFTRWDSLWIGALLIIGLLIGINQLDSVPNNLIPDEGNFYTRAQTIAKAEEQQSFFDVGVYTYPLASSFYQGGILRLFGDSLWSWRFSSVLAGILSVIPLYLLTRDLFDRRTAVISGLLLVTLPYFIAFERLGYNNAQAILPVTLALYLLYLAIQRESIFYFALSGVVCGLGFYTYTASRLGLLIAGIFFALLIIAQLLTRLRSRHTEAKQLAVRRMIWLFIGGAIVLGFALVTIVPHLTYVNFVAPDSLRYKMLESLLPNINYGLSFFPPEALFRDFAPFHVGSEIFYYRPDFYIRLFVRGIVRSLLVFHDPVLANSEYLVSPLSGTVGVVFYYIGLVFALRNIRRKEFALLLIWWFGSIFFLSMISTFPPRYQHTIPVIPMIALFSALGLTVTINAFTQLIRRSAPSASLAQPFKRTFALVAAVLLAILVVTNLRTYFVDMPPQYKPNLENIMAFDALHLDEPTDMIYVHPATDGAAWTPWMITYMPNQAIFQAIQSDEFERNPPTFLDHRRYIIYFDEKTALIVKTVLRRAFGSLDLPLIPYYDEGNRVVGLSYTFVLRAGTIGSG